MSSDLRQRTTRGAFWSLADRFSEQFVQFGVGIILARLLTPAEFGLTAMVTIFLGIAGTLVDAGFSAAIIQKREFRPEVLSSVFYVNMGVASVVAVVLWLSAPLIAAFYAEPSLTDIVRVIVLAWFPLTAAGVHRAILERDMDYKTILRLSLPATLLSGVAGVGLAFAGFGVWALVLQSMVRNLATTLLLWAGTKWRPQFAFSTQGLGDLFHFGSRLALSGLVNTIFFNIYPLLIGKFYSPADVGFYQRANSLVNLPITNIMVPALRIAFPLFSTLQEQRERLRAIFQRSLMFTGFLCFMAMAALAGLAGPLVQFLIGEKWLPAVPFLQLLCVPGALYPVHALNLNLLMGIGRSGSFLKLEIIKKALIAIALVVTVPHGMLALLYGQIVTAVLSLFLNLHYTKKMIGYSTWEQLRDLLLPAGAAVALFGLLEGMTRLTTGWQAFYILLVGGALCAVCTLLSLRIMPAILRGEVGGLLGKLPGPWGRRAAGWLAA